MHAPDVHESPFSGPLGVPFLLDNFYRRQISGRVDFVSGDIHKAIFFERGAPVAAYSNQVFDRFEEYLLRHGKISRVQFQELRQKGFATARRIGAFLVSAGKLKSDELFEVVRGHLRDVVFSLFELEKGAYRYLGETASDDERVALDTDPRALVLEGIRRKFIVARMMVVCGPPSSLVGVSRGARVDLDGLELDADERRVVRYLDGSRSLEDIVFSTGLPPVRVYHVATGLVALGLAQVLVRGAESAVGEEPADDIDRGRIRARLEQMRDCDYFEILGVSRFATPFEVERAYSRSRREFSSERFSDRLRAEYGEELTEIERVLEDARQVLCDTAMRDAYAYHLPRPGEFC